MTQRSFLSMIAMTAILCFTSSLFALNVTQSSTRNWTVVTGATTYEISAQTGVGHPLGDGVNILATTDVGNITSLPTSAWLSGQQLNQPYQLFVRGVKRDGSGNLIENGPWGQLDVTLVGELTAPVLSYQTPTSVFEQYADRIYTKPIAVPRETSIVPLIPQYTNLRYAKLTYAV